MVWGDHFFCYGWSGGGTTFCMTGIIPETWRSRLNVTCNLLEGISSPDIMVSYREILSK